MQSDKNIAGVSAKSKSTYKEIFSSSLIVGGTQFVTLFFNLIRAKVLALILGPAGTGLIGIYTSTNALINTIAGLGVKTSAVKQVAKSVGTNDKIHIAKTIKSLRVFIFFSSLAAGLLVVLFSKQVSQLTFGDTSHQWGIAAMSLVIFFTGLSEGQWALLQGYRMIKRLALSRIIGAFLSTAIGITIIYFFEFEGIILFIITGSFATLLLSWFFSSKVKIADVKLSIADFKEQIRTLVSWGVAFLLTGLIIQGSEYLARILIVKNYSVESVGVYTASYTLSVVYVNFILGAMSADFYPRLTSKNNDGDINLLVNEQIVMGLLLSMAGVISVIAFAPFFLQFFYSKEFVFGTNLLQWFAAGMAVKIFSWPVGFIIIAKGKKNVFMAAEITWGILYMALLYTAVQFNNITYIGVAFCTTYLIHALVVYILAKNLTGFSWSKKSISVISIFLVAVIVMLLNSYLFDYLVVNIIVFCLILAYCIYMLKKTLNLSMAKIMSVIKKKLKI